MKRILSLALALFMILASLSGLTLVSSAAQDITVTAKYGKIENYAGKTYFIVGVSSSTSENNALFGPLQNDRKMAVTVKDETAGDLFEISEYCFDIPGTELGGSGSYGTWSGSFMRLAFCDYGLVPVVSHAYTVTLNFYDGDTLVATGTSAAGAFVSSNAAYLADGPIIPDPVPHPQSGSDPIEPGNDVQEITVTANWGKVENYQGNTYFIVGVNSGAPENNILFGKLQNEYTLKVSVKDELTGKTYVIDEYKFTQPSLELGGSSSYGTWSGSFMRLAVCDYGIFPAYGHTYTLTLRFMDGSKVVAEGASSAGAFPCSIACITPATVPYPVSNPDSITENGQLLTLTPYMDGFENWTGSPNVGDAGSVTQILVCPKSGDKFSNAFGTALMDLHWAITMNDGTTAKTVTLDPISNYFAGSWGIIRFEPCEAEGADRFIPKNGSNYTLSAVLYAGEEPVYYVEPTASWNCRLDPIYDAEELTDPVFFDVNGDGSINIQDVTSILFTLSVGGDGAFFDFDGDGVLGISDVSLLLYCLQNFKVENGIFEETIENVRVQVYSDSVIRLETKKNGGFCDNDTVAVTNRSDWEGATVMAFSCPTYFLMQVGDYIVTIPRDAQSLKNVTVSGKGHKVLWYYVSGMDATTYLPEPANTPECWSFNDNPRVIMGPNGFEVPASAADYSNNNGWLEQTYCSDFYVFLPKNDVFALREDFVHLTGQCDLVPIKTLGLWFSRWHAYSASEVMDLIDEYRRRGYPIDMIVNDTDWRSSSDGTGYTVNTRYFPDVVQYFRDAADANVMTLFNDHVHSSTESILSYNQLSWFNQGIKTKIAQGLSSWWYDRNWTHHLISPFSSLNGDMMGQLMYLDLSKSYRHSVGSNTRTFLLSNVYWNTNGSISASEEPHVSTHRYSLQWTGDIGSSYSNIRNELSNMVFTGARTGIGLFTSDIGGFTGSPDERLFIRWSQYGALSPIMRYHSMGTDRSPWTVGSHADEIANTYIRMRYRLMPLYYTLAYENHEKGLPICRRLDFYYPQHSESKDNTEYLLGEDILVAPIYDSTLQSAAVPGTWLTTENGTRGLTGRYYNNKTMTGTPALTRVDSSINFNWGQNAPASGVNTDNFSIVWEGYINVGSNSIQLGTVSDDGVRVYIDGTRVIDNWAASDSVTVMSGVDLAAGTRHSIRIEYFDNSYDAKIQLLYTAGDLFHQTDSRNVFLPDGTWMNVFTGETFVGPRTVKVSCDAYTSPLFVKVGALLTLCPVGDYASTAQFENLTLDYYPGANTSDTTLLYEDDGATEDYMGGASRSTLFTAECGESGTTITVAPTAAGGYECSFAARTYTLRIHGSDYTTATVNGVSYTLTEAAADTSAAPFAVEGGSPEGAILTVSFTADVNEALTITLA